MDKVMSFDDLERISNKWEPEFIRVDSIEDASEHINFPHEDYPYYINSTSNAIQIALDWLGERSITERDIREIHQICMDGKDNINLGKYRIGDVVVANKLIPPQPYLIPPMMMSIFPINFRDYDEPGLIKWYKIFETIHPFTDGNGRVGGVVLASMSYLNSGKFIVPKKDYNSVISPILDRIENKQDSLLNNPRYFDVDLDFDTRCIQYIIGKMNGVKFRNTVTKFGYYDAITKHMVYGSGASSENIKSIKYILNKIISTD